MANPEVGSNRRRRLRRTVWMLGCIVAGAAIIAIAVFGEDDWHWQGALLEVLIGVGIAILLAPILYLLEEQFKRPITERVQRARNSISERSDKKAATRIENLQRKVHQRDEEFHRAQDALLKRLKRPTFVLVTAALAEANRVNCLWKNTITVEASGDSNGVGFTFGWGTRHGDAGPKLIVEARLPYDPGLPGPHDRQNNIAVEWRQNDSVDQFISQMNSQLQAHQQPTDEQSVNWTRTMTNLRDSLRLAIQSKRPKEPPWRLAGKLDQIVGTDWAITSAGIEGRADKKVVVPSDEIPHSPWIRLLSSPHDTDWQLYDWTVPLPESVPLNIRQALTWRSRELFAGVARQWSTFSLWQPVKEH